MSALIRYYHEMKAYRLAFTLQQQIFVASRRWPNVEAYSLTARTLRSARAIGASLAQALARRGEPAEFVARLTEVDAQVAETVHWLETAHCCGYIEDQQYRELRSNLNALGRMLSALASGAQKLSDAGLPPPKLPLESRPVV